MRSPSAVIGSPASVTVQIRLATSNAEIYTYLASSPIAFNTDVLTLDIAAPTSAAFGTEGKLYVGTLYDSLVRLTLDSTLTKVTSSVVAPVLFLMMILWWMSGSSCSRSTSSGFPRHRRCDIRVFLHSNIVKSHLLRVPYIVVVISDGSVIAHAHVRNVVVRIRPVSSATTIVVVVAVRGGD